MAIKYCIHNGPAGTGDGSSVANAWSLADALSGLTSADELRVCNTGTYALTGAAKSWTALGTADTPMKIQGADASGNSYAGTASMVTLSGSGMTASADMFDYSGAAFVRYRNIRFTASRAYGHHITGAASLYFHDCQVDSCLSSGVYVESTNSSVVGFRSRFDHNKWGLQTLGWTRGRFHLYDCVIDHNSSGGIYDSMTTGSEQTKPILSRCLIFRNSGPGVQYFGNTNYGFINVSGCVFFGNTSHGLSLPNATCGEFVVTDSILRSNGGYGIYTATTTDLDKFLFRNLCSHNNTSGHIDINSGTLLGTGHVLEDPAFVSETDGSENLTSTNMNLRKSFAYPAGGTTYFWPGAVQPAFTIYSSSGGGGGATASEIADAVCDEILGGHTISGSLAAVLAAVPTAAQNAAAISTPIPANVTQVNGSAVSVATGLATASALATVDTNIDTLLTNVAALPSAVWDEPIADHVASGTVGLNQTTIVSNISTVDTKVDSIVTKVDTVDTVVDTIKLTTDKIDPLIVDGAFTAESLANVPTGSDTPQVVIDTATKLDKMIVADGADDFKFDENSLEDAPVGGNAGTGAYDYTIEPIRDVAANPISGVLVRVYSDANCRTLEGSNITDATGTCLFHLNSGEYWAWADKDGYSFNNPDAFTVEVPET